jgi:hypothetical protein
LSCAHQGEAAAVDVDVADEGVEAESAPEPAESLREARHWVSGRREHGESDPPAAHVSVTDLCQDVAVRLERQRFDS